ncbi:Phospholipid phosphatase 6 [Rhynchospora pubera]|uniref:Phospholipid phosphatase 6 n=1 Tax=Rhynchospora pubera TaxID=906938 RepID=A0AAV8H9B9_9POAL|nr:Phospholipid phosphatase 6 [Rhynchospora pubera]
MATPISTPTTAIPPPSSSFLQSFIALDTSLSLHLHTFFQFIPRFLLKSLEICGDGRLFFPVAISLLFLLSPSLQSPHPFLLSLLAGSLLDLLLVGLIKHLIRRPRPVYNKSDMSIAFAVDHWSFPSGHSSRLFFVAQFLFLSIENVREVLQDELLRNWVSGFGFGESGSTELFLKVIFCWAAATSVSRVLLGRHFVADVAAGACLGLFEGWITHRFISQLISGFGEIKLFLFCWDIN